MFVLADIEDTVRIEPRFFDIQPTEALKSTINKKFAYKVLPEVGLCICFHDFLSVNEGKVRWGDGCIYHKAQFRLAVFRPVRDEILLGRIKSSDESGIRISLGFFDDIHVSKSQMPEYATYDHSESLWFTLFDPPESYQSNPLHCPKEERFWLDNEELIKFRIISDEFRDPEPGPIRPELVSSMSANANGIPGQSNYGDGIGGTGASEKAVCYEIQASIAEQMLGPVSCGKVQLKQRNEKLSLHLFRF